MNGRRLNHQSFLNFYVLFGVQRLTSGCLCASPVNSRSRFQSRLARFFRAPKLLYRGALEAFGLQLDGWTEVFQTANAATLSTLLLLTTFH